MTTKPWGLRFWLEWPSLRWMAVDTLVWAEARLVWHGNPTESICHRWEEIKLQHNKHICCQLISNLSHTGLFIIASFRGHFPSILRSLIRNFSTIEIIPINRQILYDHQIYLSFSEYIWNEKRYSAIATDSSDQIATLGNHSYVIRSIRTFIRKMRLHMSFCLHVPLPVNPSIYRPHSFPSNHLPSHRRTPVHPLIYYPSLPQFCNAGKQKAALTTRKLGDKRSIYMTCMCMWTDIVCICLSVVLRAYCRMTEIVQNAWSEKRSQGRKEGCDGDSAQMHMGVK